jgi:hypothetical protein
MLVPGEDAILCRSLYENRTKREKKSARVLGGTDSASGPPLYTTLGARYQELISRQSTRLSQSRACRCWKCDTSHAETDRIAVWQ